MYLEGSKKREFKVVFGNACNKETEKTFSHALLFRFSSQKSRRKYCSILGTYGRKTILSLKTDELFT